MKKALAFLLYSSSLLSSEISRQDYLTLIDQHPEIVKPVGNATLGEIEILLEPTKMAAIEKATGRDVGVLHSDSHWIWLNDACKFPDGSEGVIGRILPKNIQRYSGAAVLPILPNGNMVLNCEFRHSTRSWELEMPRGGAKPGETVEDTARREVLEETGMVVGELIRLGEVTGDSGVTSMVFPIFMGKIADIQKPDRESSEAINQIIILSMTEIEEAFSRGYVECMIEGQIRKVKARDPFLTYALIMITRKQTSGAISDGFRKKSYTKES